MCSLCWSCFFFGSVSLILVKKLGFPSLGFPLDDVGPSSIKYLGIFPPSSPYYVRHLFVGVYGVS